MAKDLLVPPGWAGVTLNVPLPGNSALADTAKFVTFDSSGEASSVADALADELLRVYPHIVSDVTP